jgi:hypothetical protein
MIRASTAQWVSAPWRTYSHLRWGGRGWPGTHGAPCTGVPGGTLGPDGLGPEPQAVLRNDWGLGSSGVTDLPATDTSVAFHSALRRRRTGVESFSVTVPETTRRLYVPAMPGPVSLITATALGGTLAGRFALHVKVRLAEQPRDLIVERPGRKAIVCCAGAGPCCLAWGTPFSSPSSPPQAESGRAIPSAKAASFARTTIQGEAIVPSRPGQPAL